MRRRKLRYRYGISWLERITLLGFAGILVFQHQTGGLPRVFQPVAAPQFFQEAVEAPALEPVAEKSDVNAVSISTPDVLPAVINVSHSPHRVVEVPFIEVDSPCPVIGALFNGTTTANLMLDTGANYTVISPLLARKLGIDLRNRIGDVAVVTANGSLTAPLVRIPLVSVGGVEVRNLTAIVQDIGETTRFSGLLGMNFLNQADFMISSKRRTVTLYAKQG